MNAWKSAQRALAALAERVRIPDDKKRFFAGHKYSDRAYSVNPNGSYHRDNPQRPWRGKSERRQAIRARRESKADL